ncbi:tigger transposable element-derived protein 2-like [Condylostylus longicornis]|uniref:tigger transposable element-derived protein 2-like n=1 Tax=Condylostylus longicornis TaxID=2530218 RepID=UPI00244DC4DC|nr:tigger transposable element-derived protein 2-like [Condylostylus longicornis]
MSKRKTLTVKQKIELLEKAKKGQKRKFLAAEYGYFDPNTGWLSRWKKRNNIIFKKAHGEKSAADVDSANYYQSTSIAQILNQYETKNIFNADETALFYKAIPSGSMSFKKDCIYGANTTSLIQPLDAGIIRSFKAYYRQDILRKQLAAAWWLVKPAAIANCFKKCGFQPDIIEQEVEQNIVINVPADVTETDFEFFIDFDKNEQCFGEMNDDEILNEITLTEQNDNSKEEVEKEKPVRNVTKKEALVALDTIQLYFEQHGESTNLIDDVENKLLDLLIETKQTKIMDIFN